MARGRPTKYKKEYCQQLIDFFDREPEPVAWKRTYFSNGIVKSEEPVEQKIQFPTFQGFARSIGVGMSTIEDWKEKHPEFSEAYTRAKEIQEDIWVQESMAGRYNAQFAKFFGVNCLGYKDKVEQETTITGFSMRFDDMTTGEGDELSG